MAVTRRQQSNQGGDGLTVRADWQPGARTLAWDALWQRILADVLSELVAQESAGRSPGSGPDAARLARGDRAAANGRGPAGREE
jgi:hypothetical protein